MVQAKNEGYLGNNLIKRAGGTNMQGGPDKHQITGIVTSSF